MNNLGSWAAVRLIAGREITVRLASRAFRVLTIVMVVIVVGVIIVVSSLASTALSDVPVHIGTPRPRATATDQLEACSANDVLHGRT